MAKKKNLVKQAKSTAVFLLTGMVAVGWIGAFYATFANTQVKKQEAEIRKANAFLEDKLYVRAAKQYETALKNYKTDQNLTYENELLEIYKEAGMQEEYEGLVRDRMERGNASLEEYREFAKNHIDRKDFSGAIQILQDGMQYYSDETLTDLYESVSYIYMPTTMGYTHLGLSSDNGYIPAFDGNAWGYIGKNGKTILDFSYEDATCFSGSYAVVRLNGVYTLIDQDGYWNAVDKNALDAVTALYKNRLIGVKDGKYGIYTNTFQKLTEETYDLAYLSENGMIAVQKDGKWAFLDSSLKPVTEYQFTDVAINSRGSVFYKDYAVVADEQGYILVNSKGKPYFETHFADAKGIESGLFAVADETGRWGFADETGELVIECQYEDVRSFSDRVAAVQYGGEWGYINKYNTMVIEPQFAQAEPFFNGNSLVKDEKGIYSSLTLKYYDLWK